MLFLKRIHLLPITFYLLLITSLFVHADGSLAERFRNLPASARGPDAILNVATLDTDTALTRIAQLSDMGFGGVLLVLTDSTTASVFRTSCLQDDGWDKLTKLVTRAADLNIELGIQDFPLSTNETFNALDEKTVLRHVNKMLSDLQTQLSKHYGTTLAWILTRSFPSGTPSRPPDLDALFRERTGLRLETYLPALEGNELEGIVSAAYVREHVAQITANTWRARFAEPMRDLIQEAGLEAGIMAGEFLLPLEDVAKYFKRPVLMGCSTSATERAANKRITQGAHNTARRSILGLLPLERVQLVTVPVQFACKHEMDKLFMDGATRLLFDPGATAWQEETLFADANIACLYARRWQFIFQQSEPYDAPCIAWQTNETGIEMSAVARKTDSEHIYCIVNSSPNGGSVRATFLEKFNGTLPGHWNPETGEIIPLASAAQTEDGTTTVRLFVEPYGAFFVVFKE